MDPGSPSSYLPTGNEDEDSPLQQSTHPHPNMADSYQEDFASKTEDAEERTVEEMAEEEDENDGGTEADEAEQLPVKLHGYWEKCKIKDAHVLALEIEGTVAPKAESQWRTPHKALVPAPNKTKILILKSHTERGVACRHHTSLATFFNSMVSSSTILHQIA
jgi:nitric oxide reductase activation protein